MSLKKLDIWINWNRKISLVQKDKTPAINDFLYAYAHGDDGLTGKMTSKIRDNHDGYDCLSENDRYGIHNDYLINILYLAAVENKYGIKIFGLTNDDLDISAEDLQGIKASIKQLKTIFEYKTGNIDLEQLANELKDHSVYFSTLAGNNKKGNEVIYALTTENEKILHYPVFLTQDHLTEFFTRWHREGYVILSDSFQNFLSVLDTNQHIKKLGVVIEPYNSCDVMIPPLLRIK